MPHIYRTRGGGEALFYTWFSAMHTRIDMAFTGKRTEQQFADTAQSVRQRIIDIEHMGNCFDADSELARLNAATEHENIPVSQELHGLLSVCIQFNRLTLQLFDITATSKPFLPGTIDSLRAEKGFTIRKECTGISINLSGILKGYALEQIRPLLTERQIDNALVNMGNSSVMAIGNMKGTDGWNVSFPGSDRIFCLHDQCLTTSGNETTERRHIIDPRNGKMAEGRRCVAIVNRNATEGEALSTALFLADDKERDTIMRNFHIDTIADFP
ncbi:MAG: FAD:protein FMN transferase [Prevotella sp.]